MEISIGILSGGKSSRMGEDKGLLPFRGKLMIQHVIDLANSLKPREIFIVTKNKAYSEFGIPLIQDEFVDHGPAAGIHTVLKNSKTELILVLPCDTPLLSKQMVLLLLKNHIPGQVTVPKAGGRVHHILGLFEKKMLKTFLESNEQRLLKLELINRQIGLNIVDCDKVLGFEIAKMMTINVNDRNELKAHGGDA